MARRDGRPERVGRSGSRGSIPSASSESGSTILGQVLRRSLVLFVTAALNCQRRFLTGVERSIRHVKSPAAYSSPCGISQSTTRDPLPARVRVGGHGTHGQWPPNNLRPHGLPVLVSANTARNRKAGSPLEPSSGRQISDSRKFPREGRVRLASLLPVRGIPFWQTCEAVS